MLYTVTLIPYTTCLVYSIVEDLIHEEMLGEPILHLLVGKFLPSSPDNWGIAVLHPKKLCVYELLPKGNNNKRITHYEFVRSYQHSLGEDEKHFTAYSMISGIFCFCIG